jgi:fatty acid desaturase
MENQRHLNLVLFACFVLVQGYLLLIFPLYGRTLPAAESVLGIAVLLTLPTWSLLHEAIHGNLHPSSHWNRRLGRLLSIFYSAPFAALRCGHLLHHRYSRTEELSEAYDPQTTSWSAAVLRHYFVVLGGLYWAEVFVGLLVLLPRGLRKRVENRVSPPGEMSLRFRDRLDQPTVLAETRVDCLLAMALLALSVCLYREHWALLLAVLSGRAMLVSFFDNAYHYGTATGHPDKARNHRFPVAASWLVLHFNYHGVHHLYPALPWFKLPAKATEIDAQWAGGFFSAPLRQLRGPIPLPQLARE